ncbi:hypothetical protein OK349_15595 [Sphingomonas sp. BT-65]|uniref:hypothetical protein n=1 Tax=Sphingomonas sp. BT-65 TaxID=2989821 RepID=UPI0022359ECE|nr:hypothetical protein [Sphingomonas sp. BT-65]MCW4463137.1 hypothetical protein [Sphingomonas sp. BT-65]
MSMNMKQWIAAALFSTFAIASPAFAQLPPELLQGGGGSEGTLYSDAFYKSKDGFWVVMRNRTDDGLRCSVSYIANDWLYAIHGPANAREVKENAGQIWFSGKAIPAPAAKVEQVELFIRAMKGKTATYPAALTKVIPEHGTFVLFLNVKNYLRTVIKKGEDSDEFAVDLRGKQVYAAKLPQLQKAYAMLDKCMAAKGG